MSKHEDQENFLLQLEKEMIELENKIKTLRLKNLRKATIKNLKISAASLRLVAPYVLAGCIACSGAKLLGYGSPFYRDEIVKYSHYMKEFDNNGNIRTEQQYEKFSDESSIFTYYGKWTQKIDGSYSRLSQTYNLKNLSAEDVEKFINDDLDISHFLGNQISSIVETKTNLSSEEINSEPYFHAIMYGIDKEDYIVIEETVAENVFSTIEIILLAIIIQFILKCIDKKIFNFDFDVCINKIKERYHCIDTKEYTKTLKLKKCEYNRIRGNNF